MTDAPNARHTPSFHRVFRGYDILAVDNALDSMEREIAELREQLEVSRTNGYEARTALSVARAEVESWRAREERIVDLTLAAEREAHHIVARAERQSETLVERATHEVDDVVSKRRTELRALQNRIEGLTKLRQDVRASVSATIFGLERATLEMREGLTRIEQLHLETTTRQLAEAVSANEEAAQSMPEQPQSAGLDQIIVEAPVIADAPDEIAGSSPKRFQRARRDERESDSPAPRASRRSHALNVEVFPIDSYATLRAYVRPLKASDAVESVEVASYVDDTAELIVHTFDEDTLRIALAHREGSVVEPSVDRSDACSVNLHAGSMLGVLRARVSETTQQPASVGSRNED